MANTSYFMFRGAGLVAALFASSSAMAAMQGTLGSASPGSAVITVTKSVQAQISDIHDMTGPTGASAIPIFP